MPVSEDFVDFLAEGSVAIEVYGHKQENHRRNLALWDLGVIQAKTRSLRERSRNIHQNLSRKENLNRDTLMDKRNSSPVASRRTTGENKKKDFKAV